MVVRAERCEDNSPYGKICKAGVLYEAWSVWCEGVLHCTQKLKEVIFNLFSVLLLDLFLTDFHTHFNSFLILS